MLFLVFVLPQINIRPFLVERSRPFVVTTCKCMKPQGKKSVNIEADIVREMAIEKANTGKDIYVLIREAWGAYKNVANGTGTIGLETHSKDEINSGDIKASLEESPWVQRFTGILRSGNKVIVEAIQKNIEAFSLILEMAGERGADNAPAPPANISSRAEEVAVRALETAERAKRTARGDEGSPAGRKGRDKKTG